jgi:hypothetical protein
LLFLRRIFAPAFDLPISAGAYDRTRIRSRSILTELIGFAKKLCLSLQGTVACCLRVYSQLAPCNEESSLLPVCVGDFVMTTWIPWVQSCGGRTLVATIDNSYRFERRYYCNQLPNFFDGHAWKSHYRKDNVVFFILQMRKA